MYGFTSRLFSLLYCHIRLEKYTLARSLYFQYQLGQLIRASLS